MSSTPYSRRQFLLTGLSLLPALAPFRVHRRCEHGPARHHGDHPTPRPGIDASKVLTPEQLQATPGAIAAFNEVRQIPAIVDGIRCHCGCAGGKDFYSLLSCYEAPAMARICDICRGQGRYAFRLHKSGKSLDEIRAAIDDRYA